MNDKVILLVEENLNDEALDYLHGDGNGLPDIVLLDLKLPKTNALEVSHRVRTELRTRLLPVVILATSRKRQGVINGYHLGAKSYIRKPVDFAQFTALVRQMGVYWLMMNESPPCPRS